MEITRTKDCQEGIRAFLDKRKPATAGPDTRTGRSVAPMATEALPAGYRQIPARDQHRARGAQPPDRGRARPEDRLRHRGRPADYAEIARRVNRLADNLRAGGIERGMPVLIRLPNGPEFPVAFLALVKLGALPVLQNSLLGPSEVEYVLGHCEARAAITMAEIASPCATSPAGSTAA